MACCGQNPVGSGAVAVDACKRVNYTLGMLLGVDDFVQESTYHTARRQALAREVLGYGTVRGLDVVVEPDGDRGLRLRVTPGAAWLPSGTPVCADTEQCCNLNDWLAAHAREVEQTLAGSASPTSIALHVVLSYARCLTDNVIIPGEPCRSDDELMQPSRVADGFRLELSQSAPPQREEDAIRDFVDWLSAIRVVTDSPPIDEESFMAQLRAAAHAWLVQTSPPPAPDDFMVGVPPGGLRVDDDLRRAALRLWTTELRPVWMARAGCGCAGEPPAGDDDALLLASLDVPLVSTGAGVGWRVSDDVSTPVAIDQQRRPTLLTLRMVQELLRQRGMVEPGESVDAADAFGLPPAAGTSLDYSRADHSHGSPPLPPFGGDLQGVLGGETKLPPEPPRVVGLRGRALADAAPTPGQALVFGASGWAPSTISPIIPGLSGDLAGVLGGAGPTLPMVTGLRGRPVASTQPSEMQVLVFSSGQWTPGSITTSVPTLSGDLGGVLGGTGASLPRVAGLQGRAVAATAPADGQALIFTGGQWAPAGITAPAGSFVGRGRDPYEIVAASETKLTLNNGEATVSGESRYGGLVPISAKRGPDNLRMLIEMQGTVTNAAALPQYLVKLTPMLAEDRAMGFRLFLRQAVSVSGDTISFIVVLLGDQQVVDGSFEFRFQAEVSRYRSN